ncbi:MAG TPA: glucosaminidase domain-containing protein [Steroidobacteraceae bacterium]|nr:glucosaminidase domain-containing protein [Steroidobacteraceae bacterium]
MSVGPVSPSLYADPAALGALRRDAAAQTPEALRETAKQFESLFTSLLLKSMRESLPGDPFGSDQQDFYQDMFDQQLATQLSNGKGLGLADVLVRQLMQGSGSAPDAAAGLAAQGTGGPASGQWPPRNADEFVRNIRPAATAAARELGVDADTIIAHAALETGWGRSMPTGADGRPSFNLFGIKAGSGWKGDVHQSPTKEFTGGRMQEVTDGFRAYSSPEQSIRDYVGLLKGNPRYAGALDTGSDAEAFARGLARGGYATDPDYVTKLTAVAARLKLAAGEPITRART